MPTSRVDTSQVKFNRGFETILIAIKEELISWNREELKKQLDEAEKFHKKTLDPYHAGRFKALSFLYLKFGEFTSKEEALVKLKEEYERQGRTQRFKNECL